VRPLAHPALSAGLALALLLSGIGYLVYLNTTREVPARGGRVVVGLVSDGPLSLLPPFAADDDNSRDLSAALYRGLTAPGSDGAPRPELARSWEVDPAARHVTFHLRRGLRWSDGVPITSADVVYTVSLLQSDVVRVAPVGQAWQGVRVAAPDPLTVVFDLQAPSAPFLSQTAIGILPRHALQSRPAGTLREVIDAPVSGPFRLVATEHDRWLLSRNPESPEQPYLDSIELRFFPGAEAAVSALVAGQTDAVIGLAPEAAAHVARSASRQVLAAPTFAYTELLFNQRQAPLTDPAVRRAIGLAIDRRALVKQTLLGYARSIDSPIPPAIRWIPAPSPQPVDPSTARKVLDQAGWRIPAGRAVRHRDGQDLNVSLSYPSVPPYLAVASAIKRDLAPIGVGVKLNPASAERSLADVLQTGAFQMALTSIDNGPDPDVYVLWHSGEAPPAGVNFSGMPKDVFLDKDLEDGRFKPDPLVRRKAYVDAEKFIAQDDPACFLFTPNELLGVSVRLKGARPPGAVATGQRLEYVQNWYIATSRVRR
jgi:peptide/nickel transport system substrate-binding protein